ncbi:unnamed protein product [Brassica oleracea var. botrytis]
MADEFSIYLDQGKSNGLGSINRDGRPKSHVYKMSQTSWFHTYNET